MQPHTPSKQKWRASSYGGGPYRFLYCIRQMGTLGATIAFEWTTTVAMARSAHRLHVSRPGWSDRPLWRLTTLGSFRAEESHISGMDGIGSPGRLSALPLIQAFRCRYTTGKLLKFRNLLRKLQNCKYIQCVSTCRRYSKVARQHMWDLNTLILRPYWRRPVSGVALGYVDCYVTLTEHFIIEIPTGHSLVYQIR